MIRFTAFLILILSFSNTISAQNLVTTSKIQGDSISIKWLPSDFEQLKLISKGATIYRIESKQEIDLNTLDFTNSKTWTINSLTNRYDAIDESTVEGQKHKVLLEPLFSGTTNAEVENFSFGTALIENIVHPSFQYILGNILIDKDFPKNKSFVYKIEVKGIDPAFVFIDSKKPTQFSAINDLTLNLDERKTVDIEWAAKKYEKESFGFDIEHSVDEIAEGTYLTEKPFLPFRSDSEIMGTKTKYRDLPEPGHFHYYRIHGRDMFGNPALISEWKKIYVPLLIAATAKIDTLYADKTDRVVKGSIQSFGKKMNINSVHLMRSSEREGGYKTVKSIDYSDSTVKFSLQEPITGDHYYYKIVLTNKDDSVRSSPRYLFTFDQVPPSPPFDLAGNIDSNGVVTLNWASPSDKDIKGYRVYRANMLKEEFIEKTEVLITGNQFTDTVPLNNLTSEIYYKVQTVDLNMNQSFKSGALLLLKPDTIAPIPAVINDILIQDTVLHIKWTNSDSQDLKNNVLIRTQSGKVDTLTHWTTEISSFIDSNIIPGNQYDYTVLTYDKSLNRSNSRSFSKYYEPGYRKPISNFKATVDLKNKFIRLTWSAPQDEIFSYQINRGKGDDKPIHLKTIKGGLTFEDKGVRINNKYSYTLKYINKEGIHSIPAKIEVIYQ